MTTIGGNDVLNTINFLQNVRYRQLRAWPPGRDMQCLLWEQSLIYVLHSHCIDVFNVILCRIVL